MYETQIQKAQLLRQRAAMQEAQAKVRSADALTEAERYGNAAEKGEVAERLYRNAEACAASPTKIDDKYIAPFVADADGLVAEGLEISPEPPPPPEMPA